MRSPQRCPGPAAGPQIRNSNKLLFISPTTLDSSKGQSRNRFCLGPRAPTAPLISAVFIKNLGPSGRYPTGTRWHQSSSADASSTAYTDTMREGRRAGARRPSLSGKHSSCRVSYQQFPQHLCPHSDDGPMQDRGSNPTTPVFQSEKLRHNARDFSETIPLRLGARPFSDVGHSPSLGCFKVSLAKVMRHCQMSRWPVNCSPPTPTPELLA